VRVRPQVLASDVATGIGDHHVRPAPCTLSVGCNALRRRLALIRGRSHPTR
jgi:hypothetical protein